MGTTFIKFVMLKLKPASHNIIAAVSAGAYSAYLAVERSCGGNIASCFMSFADFS